MITCRAWPFVAERESAESRAAPLLHSLHLELCAERASAELCSAKVAGSKEPSKMGVEDRNGQNGYLPDASTSSFDVAAVPSDTSYDRDPEARSSVALYVPRHNSDTATYNLVGRAGTCPLAGTVLILLRCLHQHLCPLHVGPLLYPNCPLLQPAPL